MHQPQDCLFINAFFILKTSHKQNLAIGVRIVIVVVAFSPDTLPLRVSYRDVDFSPLLAFDSFVCLTQSYLRFWIRS